MGDDPDGYGVLRPLDPSLSIKSVSQQTALLLLTLREPFALPRYAASGLGTQRESVVAQMVLDGILEVECDGRFISGPQAYGFLFSARDFSVPAGTLSALSHRAIAYAASIDVFDALSLSARLYAFNRVPASPRWRRLLEDEAAVQKFLGVRSFEVARLIEAAWIPLPAQSGAAWIAWHSRCAIGMRGETPRYKLYVSPQCAEVPRAFTAAAQALSSSRCCSWKVGNDVYGLLRPDKMVAYFQDFADLQLAAQLLADELAGCSVQGVPFTAEIAGNGLLSWGADPPQDAHSVRWLERESWRIRLCNRLGSAIAQAKAQPAQSVSAAHFALDRLRLDGVNIDTWAPAC